MNNNFTVIFNICYCHAESEATRFKTCVLFNHVNCSIWPVINKQINAVQDSIVGLCSVVFRRLCDDLEAYMDNSEGWIVFIRRFLFVDRKLYSKAGVQFFFNVLENLAFCSIWHASETI